MSIEAAKACIRHAQADLNQALVELDAVTPPEPPAAIVSTPPEFDEALLAAVPGDVIVCAVSLVYPSVLTIRTAGIQIISEHSGTTRITDTESAPAFGDKIILEAADVRLSGLQISHGKWTDILQLAGANPIIDRCRILGDTTTGARRGIAANAANVTITRCHIDLCFGPYPGDDTQAICAWKSLGPILIEDCYLCGGSETVMFGGSDPPSSEYVPADITIRLNTITKRAAWQQQAVGVKNIFELKNAKRVLIENNTFSYSWGGHGQDGFALVLTPRNQSGTAPYSTVEDVEIRQNRFSCSAGAISFLGHDNNYPSQRLARVNIHHNVFEDLSPSKYTGTNKMLQIQAGPMQVTIDSNEFYGAGLSSQVYFSGSPQCDQITVTNNKWPHTTYGIFGSGSSTGTDPATGLPKAWVQYVASGQLANNTEWPATRSTVKRLYEWALRCVASFGFSR